VRTGPAPGTARPGRRAELLAALQPLVEAAIADEPGTELFVLNVPDGDPDAVISFEIFRDAEALAAHASSPAAAGFKARMGELLARPPEPVRATPAAGKGLAA
jgi:quinol monooxygenase YgiN